MLFGEILAGDADPHPETVGGEAGEVEVSALVGAVSAADFGDGAVGFGGSDCRYAKIAFMSDSVKCLYIDPKKLSEFAWHIGITSRAPSRRTSRLLSRSAERHPASHT